MTGSDHNIKVLPKSNILGQKYIATVLFMLRLEMIQSVIEPLGWLFLEF